MIGRRSMWVWGMLSWGVMCGCASNPNAPKTAEPASAEDATSSDLLRYLPLEDNTVYAYKTEDLVAKTSGVFMLRVRRHKGNRADLLGGVRIQRLVIEPQGILREAEGNYLLKKPLAVGTTWRGGPDAVSRITSVDKTIKVEAGDFDRCLEVIEDRTGALQGTITTVYCPAVGIVLLETQGKGPESAPIHERLELRSFGKAIDIGTRPK